MTGEQNLRRWLVHRLSMRSALVLVAAATLTLAACGSKATDSSSSTTSAAAAASGSTAGSGSASSSGSASAGGALTIVPLKQLTPEGKDAAAAAAGTPVTPAGNGKATCPAGTAIGMAGPLTGSSAALGINIIDGAQLAISQFNKANPGCQITIKKFDTEGDPQKATPVSYTHLRAHE